MANDEKTTPNTDRLGQDMNLVVGVSAGGGAETVTARKAGGLIDMKLPVSPAAVPVKTALENLAKAVNLALQADFLETELERVYGAARVRKGVVRILHKEYIGLGDGLFAKIGRAVKSIQLTLKGSDPAAPEGLQWRLKATKSHPVRGVFDLIGRKLDLLQEFEDKVPTYVEQMLDRLEAAGMINGWKRTEWEITTDVVGLDVSIKPIPPTEPAPTPTS